MAGAGWTHPCPDERGPNYTPNVTHAHGPAVRSSSQHLPDQHLTFAALQARVLLHGGQEGGKMQALVEIATIVTGMGVALVAGRLVLQGILVATFGKR